MILRGSTRLLIKWQSFFSNRMRQRYAAVSNTFNSFHSSSFSFCSFLRELQLRDQYYLLSDYPIDTGNRYSIEAFESSLYSVWIFIHSIESLSLLLVDSISIHFRHRTIEECTKEARISRKFEWINFHLKVYRSKDKWVGYKPSIHHWSLQ